jgi:hypothetical protein
VGGVLAFDVLADGEEEDDDALLPMCELGSAAEVLEAIRYRAIGTPRSIKGTHLVLGCLAGCCAI